MATNSAPKTPKAKTWRSFQFLDTDIKTKVVDLLGKASFGADVGYKVDGSYVLTNAPVRDLTFALKRELGIALPDATILDGDPRDGEVVVNAETPVEMAADVQAEADKVAAAATKAAEAAQRKAEREKAAADKKAAQAEAKAKRDAEKAAEKEAKAAARAKAAEEKKAASPTSIKAKREAAGEAEGTVLNRNTRMYASTVEVQCSKCQAIKEVHVRSWAGIGYTYCNNCHAKLPYTKSGDGLTEQDRKSRSMRRTLDSIGRLIEPISMLTDAERAVAASLYEAIRHHVNAPAWQSGVSGSDDSNSAEEGTDEASATEESDGEVEGEMVNPEVDDAAANAIAEADGEPTEPVAVEV